MTSSSTLPLDEGEKRYFEFILQKSWWQGYRYTEVEHCKGPGFDPRCGTPWIHTATQAQLFELAIWKCQLLFSLPKRKLIKGYKWSLLSRSQNFPLFRAGEYLINKLGKTMACWLDDNPRSVWLPSLYLDLSTAMSNPGTSAKPLTSSVIWKSASSENSPQKY